MGKQEKVDARQENIKVRFANLNEILQGPQTLIPYAPETKNQQGNYEIFRN